MKKYLMIAAAKVIAFFFIVSAIKTMRQPHPAGIGEKTGRSIDNRLKESKSALDKATAHVRSVLEHLKNLKR